MIRKAQSGLLVLWIGGICPVLCAHRAVCSDSTLPTSCCERTEGQRDSHRPPTDVPDTPRDRCFCSSVTLPVSKANWNAAMHLNEIAVAEEIAMVLDDASQSFALSIEAHSHDPPRLLVSPPLLI